MVELQHSRPATALDAWWVGAARAGVVTVQRRLQLGPPEGDPMHGWTMQGRVRRLTTLHWVPVEVELWSTYEGFMMMTMTPHVRVLASKRYFRLGHSVLDRLWADLSEVSAHADRAAFGPPTSAV